MDATEHSDALRLWGLTVFRATTFLLSVVVLLHLEGRLQSSLSKLETLSGFVAFAAFLGTTFVASRLGERCARHAAGDGSMDSPFVATIIAGAWNGTFVFVLITVALFVAVVMTTGNIRAILVSMFACVIGSCVAFAVGGVVGLIYALLEGVLLTVSVRLSDAAHPQRVPRSS